MAHPFVLEMIQGSLCWGRFSYYLEQDKLYLQDYARCLAVIADKSPIEYRASLSRYINHAVIAEQDKVYGHYDRRYQLTKTGLIAPATLSYTGSLLRTCMNEPVEVAVASVLPCFWLYHCIGRMAQSEVKSAHRYKRWIDVYSSDEFEQGTNSMIDLFDAMAAKSTEETREKMVAEFGRSASYEWCFFNDAYHRRVFGGKATDLVACSRNPL